MVTEVQYRVELVPSPPNYLNPVCWAKARGVRRAGGSVTSWLTVVSQILNAYRRLVRAGVPAVGRMVAGTCHGGDLLFPGVMPEVFDASMRDVSGFVKSLG